jgi:hypothetical protein
MYLAVVIHPDNPPESQVQVVGYAGDYHVANGMALRAWEKAQKKWANLPDNTKNEPPLHDIYICERRRSAEFRS